MIVGEGLIESDDRSVDETDSSLLVLHFRVAAKVRAGHNDIVIDLAIRRHRIQIDEILALEKITDDCGHVGLWEAHAGYPSLPHEAACELLRVPSGVDRSAADERHLSGRIPLHRGEDTPARGDA